MPNKCWSRAADVGTSGLYSDGIIQSGLSQLSGLPQIVVDLENDAIPASVGQNDACAIPTGLYFIVVLSRAACTFILTVSAKSVAKDTGITGCGQIEKPEQTSETNGRLTVASWIIFSLIFAAVMIRLYSYYKMKKKSVQMAGPQSAVPRPPEDGMELPIVEARQTNEPPVALAVACENTTGVLIAVQDLASASNDVQSTPAATRIGIRF